MEITKWLCDSCVESLEKITKKITKIESRYEEVGFCDICEKTIKVNLYKEDKMYFDMLQNDGIWLD
jgi:hypothetical protein